MIAQQISAVDTSCYCFMVMCAPEWLPCAFGECFLSWLKYCRRRMKNFKTIVIFVFFVGIFYGLLELSVQRDGAGSTHSLGELGHVFIYLCISANFYVCLELPTKRTYGRILKQSPKLATFNLIEILNALRMVCEENNTELMNETWLHNTDLWRSLDFFCNNNLYQTKMDLVLYEKHWRFDHFQQIAREYFRNLSKFLSKSNVFNVRKKGVSS